LLRMPFRYFLEAQRKTSSKLNLEQLVSSVFRTRCLPKGRNVCFNISSWNVRKNMEVFPVAYFTNFRRPNFTGVCVRLVDTQSDFSNLLNKISLKLLNVTLGKCVCTERHTRMDRCSSCSGRPRAQFFATILLSWDSSVPLWNAEITRQFRTRCTI
jgi:hypothetical protein